MTWFDIVMVWLIKPLAEMLWALLVVAAIALVYGLVLAKTWLANWRRQHRCKHERIKEDYACNAWCLECGSNLGFIGDWRHKQQAKAPQ